MDSVRRIANVLIIAARPRIRGARLNERIVVRRRQAKMRRVSARYRRPRSLFPSSLSRLQDARGFHVVETTRQLRRRRWKLWLIKTFVFDPSFLLYSRNGFLDWAFARNDKSDQSPVEMLENCYMCLWFLKNSCLACDERYKNKLINCHVTIETRCHF